MLPGDERQAFDAEFALTEGAGGELDAQGRRVALEILAAEKTSQRIRVKSVYAGRTFLYRLVKLYADQ